MKRIYKYPLTLEDRPTVDMPLDAEILCVQMQAGFPFVWALVDPTETVFEARRFAIYGTGRLVDEPGKYLGTVQMEDGLLVWHIFMLPYSKVPV